MGKLSKKIGLIGCGNMGEAFLAAIIKSGISSSSKISVCDIRKERLDIFNQLYGVSTTKDNFKLFSESDVVILAVKPQQMDQVLADIAKRKDFKITKRKLIISIAAGISIKNLENSLYSNLDESSMSKFPIIRVMPNTPALVLSGMSGMSANRYSTADDIKISKDLLQATGKVIQFKEKDLDAVTALSGSGPAYVFFFIESMIEAGISLDLNPEDAAVLTLTTLKGALKLIEELNESPKSLRNKVTSPGGTTEAAIDVLDNKNVRQNIIDAVVAAYRRSKELGL